MTNTKRWSHSEFLGLNVRELENRLAEAERFVERHPQFEFGWHNEYRHALKQQIAEKIGVKK